MRTVRAVAEALGIKPGDLADPEEVAEVRRSAAVSSRSKSRDEDRIGAWNDDGGAALGGRGGSNAE